MGRPSGRNRNAGCKRCQWRRNHGTQIDSGAARRYIPACAAVRAHRANVAMFDSFPIGVWYLSHPNLSPDARSVTASLLANMDGDAEVTSLSLADLSATASMSKPTLLRTLSDLEGRCSACFETPHTCECPSFASMIERVRIVGSNRPTRYVLHFAFNPKVIAPEFWAAR